MEKDDKNSVPRNAIFYRDKTGRPYYSFEYLGQKAIVYIESHGKKRPYVYLGDNFIKLVPPLKLPADAKAGRGPLIIPGATQDKNVMKIFEAALALASKGVTKDTKIS